MDRIVKAKLFNAGYEPELAFLSFSDLFDRPTVNVPNEVKISQCRSRIEWKWSRTSFNEVHVVSKGQFGKALFDFISVSSPEDIQHFVEKWGCLRIEAREESENCEELEHWESEALDVYYRHARQLRAVLCLTADLRLDERKQKDYWTNVSDWEDATQGIGDVRFWATGETEWKLGEIPDLKQQRVELAHLINEYLLPIAHIRPQMIWDGSTSPKLTLTMDLHKDLSDWQQQRSSDQRQILKEVQKYEPEVQRWHNLPINVRHSLPLRKRPSHLLAALIIEMLAVFSSPSGVYRCTRPECGNPHQKNKKPRDASYCDDECRRQAQNQRNRNCQAKPQSEKKTYRRREVKKNCGQPNKLATPTDH